MLGKLLREELPRVDAHRVEQHVGGCPSCERMLARIVGSLPGPLALALMGQSPADEEPPTLPGHAPVERLDAGSMGVVWRVHDLQFGRPLAVKVMKSAALASPVLVERFLAEARVCGQLAHPSIVPIHAMGRLPDGRPYYTMKLVEGRTLAALLQEGAAERRMGLVRIFGSLCQAVAFAHSKGVIHRDLKPSNVMVGAHGEVQLMDWGLCKVLDRQGCQALENQQGISPGADAPGSPEATHAGSILGTVSYMPPEQARGLVAEVDRRSDVFGLGAILCEVLTGCPPYDGPSADAVRLRAAEADLAEARARLGACGADAELVQLAERCLASRREDRPTDAGEVAAGVATYLSGVEERLRQERLEHERSRARAVEERRRRRLWLGLAAAVLAVVGLAAGGWTYWQGQRAQRRLEASQALEQAERRLRSGDFAGAKESLNRANDRLGDGPVGLKREHDRLRAAWQLVQDLKEIEQKRTTPTDEGSFDNATAQESYARTFSAAGYDVLDGDPNEVARLVRASPVAGPILEALDNWALVCAYDMRFVPRREAERRRRRDRLLAVARAVGPDPELRDRVRSPHVWDDLRELEKLASLAPRTDLSPRLAALLAELIRWKNGSPEQLLRTFQRRYPGDFWLNFDLAKWLDRTNPAEALRFYQAALAVRPHHIVVQSHLGLNARRRLEWDEAVAVLERALLRVGEEDSLSVSLRNNLAVVLMDREDVAGALALFRRNLLIRPRQVRTHLNVARCLSRLGRLTEALESYRRAHRVAVETGSPHRALAEREAREAEQRVELERRLEAGRPETASAGESLAVAEVYHCKQRYADAVAFYRRAFEQEPKLAASLSSGLRYSAACAAALAGAGRGEQAGSLDASGRAELRKQALTWLREDLEAWGRLAMNPKARPAASAELRLWQRHPNLAGLRDPAASRLPEDEQKACRRFWADVSSLANTVRGD
jgi:serine/threonine-protein kinase